MEPVSSSTTGTTTTATATATATATQTATATALLLVLLLRAVCGGDVRSDCWRERDEVGNVHSPAGAKLRPLRPLRPTHLRPPSDDRRAVRRSILLAGVRR